jgi:HK97 family phage major capsid protein
MTPTILTVALLCAMSLLAAVTAGPLMRAVVTRTTRITGLTVREQLGHHLDLLRAAGVQLTMDATTRPTTAELHTRASTLQDNLLGLGDKLRELRETPEDKRPDTWAHDVRTTVTVLNAADAELTAVLASLPVVGQRTGEPISATLVETHEHRSAGQQFIGNAEVAGWAGRDSNSPQVTIERRALLTTGTAGGDAGALLPRGNPVMNEASFQRRRLFVRDAVSPGNTTLNSVPYVRELNLEANSLAVTGGVAEGTLKPEVTLQFEAVDAIVRKVAAWVQITTEALADMPTLASYIDSRLGYQLALAEEMQMVRGDGLGANIRGILNTPGNQVQAFVTDRAQTIGLAIGKVENAEGEADAIGINPLDFWSLVTTRNANQFDSDGGFALPYGPAPSTLWGLPAIRSKTFVVGQAVVGAWMLGAQVFDREGIAIQTAEQHGENFLKNVAVIRAEARLALAVHRPDLFVKVALL